MAKEEYKDRAGLFVYDRLQCLRNEYANNSCSECIKMCPEEAFVFSRKKLRLDSSRCTQCGVCIGSCPSEALYIETQSPTSVAKELKLQETGTLSCKEQKRCLARFRTLDLLTIALKSQKELHCDLLPCESCDLNRENKVLGFIKRQISQANLLLSAVKKQEIQTLTAPWEEVSKRRLFFKSLAKKREFEEEEFLPKEPLSNLVNTKKSLQGLMQEEVFIEHTFDFSWGIFIDKSCTNCGECVNFCPSSALSYNADKSSILFQAGKCIGCDICVDICKSNSVSKKEQNLDLTSFAFDRAKVLIQHELRVCRVCKCAFSYKGGEEVCSRCGDFEEKYADMFTLASNKL